MGAIRIQTWRNVEKTLFLFGSLLIRLSPLVTHLFWAGGRGGINRANKSVQNEVLRFSPYGHFGQH